MKTTTFRIFFIISILFSLSVTGPSLQAKGYDARIGEKEILTPLPGKAPVINGPKIYGARPDKKFIYRIPCQGARPIQFKLIGLPVGLSVNEEGIITGTTPKNKGKYLGIITAKNRYGSTTREFELCIGDKIALTPPTGWNSWGGYMLLITQQKMQDISDFFVEKGLADVGYQYLGIDDCWMRISPEMYASLPEARKARHEGFDYSKVIGEIRDKEGNILPNSSFPDMKAMVDYIHKKGLKVGIYSSPGPSTCQRWAGSYGHEEQDAEQYAKWGIDLIKYDLCSGGSILAERRKADPDYKQAELWRPMADYLKAQDRDILFNLCQYGHENPWEWAPALGIQSWRIGGDLNHNVKEYFDEAMRIAIDLRDYSKPGQWNDPDFMYIDHIRYVMKMMQPCKTIPLNTNQRYQYATLWSILCAPYFFSCNIADMDEFTLRLLSNACLLNINQDKLGKVAKVIRNKDNEVIMVKELEEGKKAVAVFNRDSQNGKTVNLSWEEIGECCDMDVYDAWRMKDLGIYKGGIETRLSPDGVAVYIIK